METGMRFKILVLRLLGAILLRLIFRQLEYSRNRNRADTELGLRAESFAAELEEAKE